ncbi:hypothetical protein GQ42DRAFT_156991 [Ramicandelaber brevisporus]|nr:hypothetical protein GQ42DRAFT_156991 [Ramicandelaber brevisporus]
MIRALKIVKHSFDRFRADKLKQEWLRLLIAIVFNYFATVFMVAMQVSSDKRYEPAKYTALRDLLFDILPLVPINYRIVDLPFATMVLLLIMISRSVPRWLDVLIAVRRIYWIQSILALPYGPNSTNKESQQQQQQKQQKQQQQQQQQQQKQQQQQQQIQQLDDANAEEMAIETTDEKNPTGSRQIMEHDKYMKLLSANYMLNDIVPQVIGWMDGIDLRC